MKIALDISPIQGTASIQHRVRGTGFYTQYLKESLLKYDKHNSYTFFTRGELLPKEAEIIHYPYFEPYFLTLPFSNIKTVVTVHDLTPLVFPKDFPAGFKGIIKWQIQKKTLQHVNAVITDSNASKNDIMRFTGIQENKIFVVYLASGENFKKISMTKKQEEVLRNKYNIPKKFCLYVGDITWNKNLPRIVEAATKAQVPLVMVGKALLDTNYDKTNPWNKDRNIVLKLTENNPYVIKTGFVLDEDLVLLYNLANAAVMPSLYEGFGLPILEAMSCGCPVITSKEGSIPEVAENAALFVDAYSTDSITEGLKAVFSSEKLQRELSAKGLQQAKKFSWEKTAKETIKVYEKTYSNLH